MKIIFNQIKRDKKENMNKKSKSNVPFLFCIKEIKKQAWWFIPLLIVLSLVLMILIDRTIAQDKPIINNYKNQIIPFFIGLICAFVISNFIVKNILEMATHNLNKVPPKGVRKKEWLKATHVSEKGGQYIGRLEQIFFYVMFFIDKPELIAGWFLFKLGSKWEVWKNIVQVPHKLNKVETVDYLRARHEWAAYIFTRFLLGTLINIVIAFLGKAINYSIYIFYFS